MAGPLAFIAGMAASQTQQGAASLLSPLQRGFEQVANRTNPNVLPGVDALFDVYLRGHLEVPRLLALSRSAGVLVPTDIQTKLVTASYGLDGRLRIDNQLFPSANGYAAIIRGKQFAPPLDVAIELFNRGILDGDGWEYALKQGGVDQVGWRQALKQLAKNIPGPSDLIRFAVREAFTPQIVQQYGYHHELPRAIYPWLKALGYGYELEEDRPQGATWDNLQPAPGKQTWFDKYWYSHWELPSVTQAADMMFRLYDDSRYGRSPDATPDNTFSEADFSTLLKVQDYPDYWRRKLTAISYQPLTRVDVRRMHKLGVMGEQDIYHAYRAIGYNDQNAMRLVQFTIEQNKLQPPKDKHYQTANDICELWNLGLITKEDAMSRIRLIGYEFGDMIRFLDACELKGKKDRFKAALMAIKKAFMDGHISGLQSLDEMASFGVLPLKAQEKLQLWNLQRRVGRKELSANQATKLFKEGIINETELERRLQNLNFEGQAITRIITQAKLDYANEYQKLVFTRAKESAKQSKNRLKSQIKMVRVNIAQNEAMVKAMLSVATDKNIIAFYKAGAINLAQARLYLQARYGWTPENIDRWIVSYLGDKGAKDNGKAPQTQTNTGQASTGETPGELGSGNGVSSGGNVSTTGAVPSSGQAVTLGSGQAVTSPIQSVNRPANQLG